MITGSLSVSYVGFLLSKDRKRRRIANMSTYSLKIKGFTPNTLPLGRLGEYVLALADLIGDDVHVNFERVTKGCAQLKVIIDDDDALIAESRIRLAPSAELGSSQRKGYEKIQSLLMADKTSAAFKPQKGAVILKFPGAPKNLLRLATVKEAGEISGRIFKIGGRDETIPVSLLTPDGDIVNCTASVEMAVKLKPYLLTPIDVILTGVGKWKRTESGKWEAIEFKINDYSVMEFDGLEKGIEGIRAAGSGWDDVADINQELSQLRYGS